MDITIETAPDLPAPTAVNPAVGAAAPGGGCGGGACTCGQGSAATPVLDVRMIPASVRHAAVHGALGAVPVDGSLVLAAPHEPLPLLAELEELHPGEFVVSYVERGPETWLVRFTRWR